MLGRNSGGTSQRPALGIRNISDAVPPARLVEYINSISEDKAQELYEFLPSDIPHTRDWLCKVVYSSYFQQGMGSLSQVLNTSGLGSIVASQLDYDYEGEGVESMLNGIRHRAKKDKK